MLREATKKIRIGNVEIGGGSPVAIQSMTNTKTEDVDATAAQILELEKAGCEIIRCAVPTMEAAEALAKIKEKIHIPLVADIHFDYRLAIAAVEHGADKIRINPGNIGTSDRVQAVVDKAKEYADLADLIIYVADASRELDENDIHIAELIYGKRCIILLNKSDLSTVISKEDVKNFLRNVFFDVEKISKYFIYHMLKKFQVGNFCVQIIEF